MIKRTKARRFLSISLAFVMMFAMMLPSTAFAAEQTVVVEVQDVELSEQQQIVPFSGLYHVGQNWVRVWTKPTGVCSWVWIRMNNNGGSRNDVQMRNAQGNVVWEEWGAIGWNGQRNFDLGIDVASVWVRVNGSGSILTSTAQSFQ